MKVICERCEKEYEKTNPNTYAFLIIRRGSESIMVKNLCQVCCAHLCDILQRRLHIFLKEKGGDADLIL